ncbi:MAG: pantoate--beta-alanine ligase [Planctomycetota bacterium]|nr:pantoate--beta-alanine ligase [Planctomycetota bacterium]
MSGARVEVITRAAGLAEHRGSVFVPTMGALHAGHAALIARARELAGGAGGAGGGGRVVVSVFVNPTQFNEARDFELYPRTLERDVEVCGAAGADVVFAPTVEEMYPGGTGGRWEGELPRVATAPGLEDAFRPGHFEGVCRVCARLFDVVGARAAVFGEKDWQQLAVIRAMVAARGGPEIVGHETVREADGLAMSSRNARLAVEERGRAASLFRALTAARGEADAESAERAGRGVLMAEGVEVEYFAVRDAATLERFEPGRAGRALVAARVGDVRLIDNLAWPAEGRG